MAKRQQKPIAICSSYLLFIFILMIILLMSGTVRVFAQTEQTEQTDRSQEKEMAGLSGEKIWELSDYEEVAGVLDRTPEKECFSSIVVESSNGQILKDGEEKSFAGEFQISKKEAGQVTDSPAHLEEFLKKAEPGTLYQIKEEGEGSIEITAPYQLKRLIIRKKTDRTFGACRAYYNKKDKETILEFDTEKGTQKAFREAKKIYGTAACFVDEVICCDNVDQAALQGSQLLPISSWGNSYMGMYKLKRQAASYGYTRKVTVAVIDTGINYSHPVFRGGRIASRSRSFVNKNKSAKDETGHGSYVAGIIVDATPDNVKILSLKVTGKKGTASAYHIMLAMRYAIEQRVQVINLSMGIFGKKARRGRFFDDIIKDAYKKGIPVCAASGNEGVNVRNEYPANLKLPITVGAFNRDGSRGHFYTNGKKKYYSNYGRTVDFAAPGTNILCPGKDKNYYWTTGTSMAAPHITAAVAYLKMMDPDLSVADIKRQLRAMSTDLGKKGKDPYFGYGCPRLHHLFKKGIGSKDKSQTKEVGTSRITSLVNHPRGIRIRWKKAGNADSYRLYRKTEKGSFRLLASLSGSKREYIDRRVKDGSMYYYKVTPFLASKAGPPSPAKGTLTVRPVRRLVTKRLSPSCLYMQWKYPKGLAAVQVRCSARSSMNKSKVYTVKKAKLRFRNLKAKEYFIQVRAIRVRKGRKYCSSWSGVRSVRLR